MNNTFAKTALAAGVLAGLGYADSSMALSLAPQAADVVVLGCGVPSAGTTVATVYSVDAVSSAGSTYTISLPTAVAVGSSCAGAIAALGNTSLNGYFFTSTSGSYSPVNQAIPGSGYSLQAFTFEATTAADTDAYVGFVGCSAPNSAGATVYSVDATNVTSVTAITTLNALVGKACSYGLAKADSDAPTGFGNGTMTGETVLNINSSGYSLNQYTFE